MKRVEIKELEYFKDERGWLLKMLKDSNLGSITFGEIYIITSNPDVTRAKHYHKLTTEWFCVIKGTAKLVLQDIKSMERKEIMMGDGKLITVKIPTGIAHAVKNISKETLYLVAFANRPYNPKSPDTYPHDITI